MRILITEQGTQILEDLESSLHPPSQTIAYQTQSNLRQSRGFSLRKTTTRRFRSKLVKTTRFINTSTSFSKPTIRNSITNNTTLLDMDNTSIRRSHYKQAKHVTIRTPKISVPKNFVEKYEKDSEMKENIIATGNILPILNTNNLVSSLQNEDNNNNTSKTANNFGNKIFSFRDIIPNETIFQLKKSIVNENEQKAKHCRITENDFRTIYQDKTELEKFDDILQCPKVTENKLSLIKYLNERKNINAVTIKSLFNSGPERINRINKMCQILLHNNEQKKVFDDLIKGKMKTKMNEDKIDFRNKIEKMKDEVNEIKIKLKRYRRRIDEREKYKDIHKEIENHHWNKWNLERFNKKGIRKNKYYKEINQKEDDNNKILNEI